MVLAACVPEGLSVCLYNSHCRVFISSAKCQRVDWSPNLCIGPRRSWKTRTWSSGLRPSTSLPVCSKEPPTRYPHLSSLHHRGVPQPYCLPIRASCRTIRTRFVSGPCLLRFCWQLMFITSKCQNWRTELSQNRVSRFGQNVLRRNGLLASVFLETWSNMESQSSFVGVFPWGRTFSLLSVVHWMVI
jgi:hypothetical protein